MGTMRLLLDVCDQGLPTGAATAVLGFVGMFRNVSRVVAPVAEGNNYLLPLWMIGFGVALLRYGRPREVVDG